MDFTRSTVGLWIPQSYLQDPTDGTFVLSHPELDLFLLVLESRFATDVEPSIDEICNYLRGYSLEAILSTAARINLKLGTADSREEMVEVQRLLARKIFGIARATEILGRAIEMEPDFDWNRRGTFFNERQTLNLLKIACLMELPEDDVERDLVRIGEALLMLSSLMDRGVSRRADDDRVGQGSSSLERYSFANSVFFQGHPMLSDLARAETLFLEPGRYQESEIDIQERLRRVLRLEPRDFMWALRMLHAFYYTIPEERVDQNAVFISRARAFSDEFDVTEEQSASFVDSACWPIDELIARVRADYSLEDLRYYDVLPFAEKPLVRFDDRVYCVSVHLMQLLAGMNLQYRFLDPNAFSEEERRRFLDYKGKLFEDYVHEILTRIYGEDRVLRESDLRGSGGTARICDFGIDYGHALLLIETKATLVPIGARFDLDQESYEERVVGTLVQGNVQLSETIDRIENGNNPRLDPNRFQKYLPIIITLELMHSPMTVKNVRRRVASAGLYGSYKVMDFVIADVSDLELLEIGALAGENVLELLERKQSEATTEDLPVRNFIMTQDLGWSRRNNPALSRKFREIQDALEETTRRLEKNESNGGDGLTRAQRDPFDQR